MLCSALRPIRDHPVTVGFPELRAARLVPHDRLTLTGGAVHMPAPQHGCDTVETRANHPQADGVLDGFAAQQAAFCAAILYRSPRRKLSRLAAYQAAPYWAIPFSCAYRQGVICLAISARLAAMRHFLWR